MQQWILNKTLDFFRLPDDMQLTIMGSCPYADTLASLMQACKKINIFKDNLTTCRDYGTKPTRIELLMERFLE